MKGTYLDLDLFRLSSECEGVDLDRQLVLLDNFDDVPGQGNGTDVWFVNHPVKLSFTVVMFCLEGWIRVGVAGGSHREISWDERGCPDSRNRVGDGFFPGAEPD